MQKPSEFAAPYQITTIAKNLDILTQNIKAKSDKELQREYEARLKETAAALAQIINKSEETNNHLGIITLQEMPSDKDNQKVFFEELQAQLSNDSKRFWNLSGLQEASSNEGLVTLFNTGKVLLNTKGTKIDDLSVQKANISFTDFQSKSEEHKNAGDFLKFRVINTRFKNTTSIEKELETMLGSAGGQQVIIAGELAQDISTLKRFEHRYPNENRKTEGFICKQPAKTHAELTTNQGTSNFITKLMTHFTAQEEKDKYVVSKIDKGLIIKDALLKKAVTVESTKNNTLTFTASDTSEWSLDTMAEAVSQSLPANTTLEIHVPGDDNSKEVKSTKLKMWFNAISKGYKIANYEPTTVDLYKDFNGEDKGERIIDKLQKLDETIKDNLPEAVKEKLGTGPKL